MIKINNNLEIINKISGEIKALIELELDCGNEICEIYEGNWPIENCIMIFLSKPFKTPIKYDLIGIKFRNINDPHYWKAEYVDIKNRLWLCCKFDGPNLKEL